MQTKSNHLNNICIALDAMGGDHGPSVVVPAALDALSEHPQLAIVLVGDASLIQNELKRHGNSFDETRLRIHPTTEKVEMDESPATALRMKKDSSMRVAINMVKSGEAAACVSAGNTGALMAIARFVLKTLPGIDRPAIVYSIPIKADQDNMGRMRMLDLGANVDCQGEHLFQFAVMGSVLAAASDNITRPRVGLLNIGSEAIKGSEAVKQAAQMLQETDMINYIGFVEGTDMYQGKADVVVCDGFVGNVALKSSEGVARMLVDFIKREFTRNLYSKFIAFLAMPILKTIKARFDPSRYNGASLLGLNGIVIKSHGNAQRFSFKQAIHEAFIEAENNVPEKIRSEVELYLGERKSS
ncbi:MAG: phosphate acyltransferase PlsX [Proteobacteria bacterium]|nr:phosphate acyltransferase PlsX [Pseudomonadota bacterium]